MVDFYLNFQDAYESENGELYVSSNKCNGLFKIFGGKSKFLGFFFDKTIDAQYLHKAVINRGDVLYFIPTWGNNIDIYKIERNKFESRYFDKVSIGLTTTNIVIDEDVVFLPRDTDEKACAYNINKDDFRELGWLNEGIARLSNVRMCFELYYATLYEDVIYAPIRNETGIMRIDYKSEIVSVLHPKLNGRKLYSMDIDKGMAWITQEDKQTILLWDIKDNSWDEITITKEAGEKYIPYIRIFFTEKKAVVVSRKSGIFYVVDKKTKKTEIIRTNNTVNEDETMNSTIWFYGGKVEGEKITLYPSRTDRCVVLDVDDYSVSYVNTGVISCGELIGASNIITENRLIGLSEFVMNL